MYLNKLKIIAGFLVIFALSACGDDVCIRSDGTRECGAGHCVDADDWGYPKIKVSAEESDLTITGTTLNQYAQGIDTGQVIIDAGTTNGSSGVPLVITIGKYDQWTSWFGGDINPTDSNGNVDPDGFDGGRTVPDIECNYVLPTGKTSNPLSSNFVSDLSPKVLKVTRNSCPVLPITAANDPTDDNYADCYTPCYFRSGMGLYIGLAPDNGSKSSPSDVVLTYHIPDAKAPDGRTKYIKDTQKSNADNATLQLASQGKDGYLVKGIPAVELPGVQTGDRLYLKIVDRTYTDNTGGYTVRIKEGTRNSSAGPLEKIASVFVDPMKIVMNRIYNGIVQSATFVNAVRAFLALYIAFYGYVFVIAGMENVKKEAMGRIFKITMLLTLISPGSYDFFYNHLFGAFIYGIQGIASLLMNPFGDYDPNDPWYSMDQVLAKLWSSETWAKIMSTLLSNSIGMLYVISIAIAIGLFMVAVIQALIIYLLAFGGIAILVVIFPIFLIFTLFTQTATLMNEWIQQLFVYGIQQIILLAGLGMFAAVIVMYLERTIGYNVCWNVWFPLDIGSIHIYDFKFWMPDISSTQAALWMDADGDGIKETVTRYIDIPYLDPVFDKNQIARVLSEKNFVSIYDILTLIGAVSLMFTFMKVVPGIANSLKSGAAADSMNIFGGGENLGKSLMGGAGMALGEIKGVADGIRGSASGLAANSEARWAGGKAKRAGVQAGRAASSAVKATAGRAASGAKKWARSTEFGQSVERAGRDVSSAARGFSNNIRESLGMETHEAQEIATKDIGGDKQLFSTEVKGLDALDKTYKDLGKGELAQRQGLVNREYRESVVASNQLENCITNFAAIANIPAMSSKHKNRQAASLLSALNSKDLNRNIIENIGMKSSSDIKSIGISLREELKKDMDGGKSKFSSDDARNIEANLSELERVANSGKNKFAAVRPGIRMPESYVTGIVRGNEEAAKGLTEVAQAEKAPASQEAAQQVEMEKRKEIDSDRERIEGINNRYEEARRESELKEVKAEEAQMEEKSLRRDKPVDEASAKKHYEMLGLKEGATVEEINRAFRLASLPVHPDKQAGKEATVVDESKRKFAAISEARNILKKKAGMDREGGYDKQLQEAVTVRRQAEQEALMAKEKEAQLAKELQAAKIGLSAKETALNEESARKQQAQLSEQGTKKRPELVGKAEKEKVPSEEEDYKDKKALVAEKSREEEARRQEAQKKASAQQELDEKKKAQADKEKAELFAKSAKEAAEEAAARKKVADDRAKEERDRQNLEIELQAQKEELRKKALADIQYNKTAIGHRIAELQSQLSNEADPVKKQVIINNIANLQMQLDKLNKPQQ